jgi:single-stranded-DNA-specific exonuclease
MEIIAMRIKQREVPAPLAALASYPEFLQRIFASRGIQDEAQLDKSLPALLPFYSLIDIEKAAIRLEKALRLREKILIIGDFDADGATSTALAVSALRVMGAPYVEFLVPNRFDFGYGLTPAIIEVAKKWQPHLIITVDNGIASLEGVEVANAYGMDVLITDHHLPGDSLPKAYAIVNPNQVGDPFPSKVIAGVGVIFYVMLALRRQLVKNNWFATMGLAEPNMAQFLDLVALGTIADVVPLDQNNRIMVNQGLARIRQGHCRPGIRALIEISGRDYSHLRESDLGFAVAPRLNAAGRLDDMSLGIECLLSDNLEKAKLLATHLDELNKERRIIEAEMKDQATIAVEKLVQKIDDAHQLPAALCLLDASWHQGVIGILAGRLKERYHRPVIAFAKVSEDELKGSARSVSGLNIRDVLAGVNKDFPGLISKFGGHAMAAGLSLAPERFSDFHRAFLLEVEKYINPTQYEVEHWTDGPLTLSDLSLETAAMLQQAGPWGQQFPEPCFDNVFEILDQRLVGQHHLKLTLAHPEGGIFDAIAFNIDVNLWPNYRVKEVHAAYKLDINSYQGRSRLQLVIETMQIHS